MKKRVAPFSVSESMKEEYCAQICRVPKLTPIENSDRLAQVILNGFSIVVGKDDVKEGEVVIYCKNETEINGDFLSANNQYELGERQRNANFREVDSLVAEGRTEEAKRMVGFFNKHGRVKMIRLRGCPSEGYIIKKESLVIWDKRFDDVDLNDYLSHDEEGNERPFNFDTIFGKEFIKAYVPRVSVSQRGSVSRDIKRNNRVKRFNRMVEGQFSFHYDTKKLNDNMWKIKPSDSVSVSVKMHGTSLIVGKLLVKQPLPNTIETKIAAKKANKLLRKAKNMQTRYPWQRMVRDVAMKRSEAHLPKNFKTTYGPVFSSRTVIKNQYINPCQGGGFYGVDIWSEYGNLLYPYLPNGMTVYCEICGYLTGGTSPIQNGYDYGCEIGQNFAMPYRITMTSESGEKEEWDVVDVYEWTVNIIEEHPELTSRLLPMDILYHGKAEDLYADIPTDNHWHENVLERMKMDCTRLGMEKDEPLCKNKVPREGIVIRIDGDKTAEAFKLKTTAFLLREQKAIDAGTVDVEMVLAY